MRKRMTPRRKTLRALTATAVVVGVVATSTAVDASVSAAPPALTGASSSSSGLNVTVGETVAVTTDQAGNTTPLNLYLVNGQVSGSGSGDVTVATGPDNATQTQSVSSASGEVSSFFKFGGTYQGDMPISVSTEVKVNGEAIDANDGYDLNGDVEITYTATNNTSRMQSVTFKDVYGNTKSKEMDIPVPFGDSFVATFGDGWDVVDTGTATSKTTGDGTVVAGTLILFPVLQGVMGGTTQSVTIKARAQGANLPSGTHTVVPINLEQYQDGSLLTLAPEAEEKIVEPAAGLLGETVDEVLLATHIISGYTSGFRKLDSDYIDPLVADIKKLEYNPKFVRSGVNEIVKGLKQLGRQLEGDAVAQGEIAGVILQISDYIGKNVPETIEWLGQVIESVGPDAQEASDSLSSLDKILQSINITQVEADVNEIASMCNTVGATATYFGGQNLSILPPNPPLSDGAAALKGAIAKVSGASKTNLQALQKELQAQSLKAYQNKLWTFRNQMPADLKFLGASAACTVTGGIMDPLVQQLEPIQDYIGPAATALAEFATFADTQAAQVVQEALVAVDQLTTLLNNKCTNAQIIDPIQAAIKQYGIANLEPHIEALLRSILANCGVVQVLEFFGDVDYTLGKLSTKAAKSLKGLSAYLPTINTSFKKAMQLTDTVGNAADAIPGLGDLIETKVDGITLGLDAKGKDALIQISDLVGSIQASLIAMNNRGLAGDGAPYGNSTLAAGTDGKISNFATYQITQEEAKPYARSWGTSIGIAVVFLLLALGLGTYLFRRRISP